MNTPSRICLLFALAFAEILLLQQPAEAATKTWSGLGADNKWSTAANWSPSGAPVAGDDLVFPAGAAQLVNSNDTSAGTSYNSISITGPAGGYDLSGNAVQLVGGITADNSSTNVIALAISLMAAQTFSSAGDRLKLNGPIALGANTLIFTTPAGGVLEVNAAISGTGGVTYAGPGGAVFISANATYSGPTNITAGSFDLVGASLNSASVVTLTGFILQFSNGASAGPVTASSGEILCGGGSTSQIGSVTDLTMQTSSLLDMQMRSATDFGQLNTSGVVTLNNPTLFLDWVFTSAPGDMFRIINKTSAGAITGTFSGLPEGGIFLSNGRNYQITYVGGDGNDVVLTDVSTQIATPTPTATNTPTPTNTPTLISTSTPTPTLPPPAAAAVPMLGMSGLAALVGLLAVAALFVLRRPSL